MSVKIDPSGRRSIQVEVEVPGTPEQVWEAIATGAGVSSWFVPTEMEGRVGGIMTCHFAPGMDSKATITSWDPPHRLTADSESFCPGGPTVATEWTVEARSGGTCVVRVVHSLFASTGDWDDQLEGTESGWPAFFRILRLYLTHFRGQDCAMFMAAIIPSSSCCLTSRRRARSSSTHARWARTRSISRLLSISTGRVQPRQQRRMNLSGKHG